MTALRDAIDTTTLGWIKPELDETLRQARVEIEAYAEDPADSGRMRACANFLHQVHGTLRMVELYAPAMVAEEMERLAQTLSGADQGQVGDRDEACAALMRGAVLLPDYLERLQGGHKDIPIVLLPLLNELRAARGETGLSESVLFAPDLDRPLPDSLPEPTPLPRQSRQLVASQQLTALREALAGWPEEGVPANIAALGQAIDGLLDSADHEAVRRMLWVAASVTNALRDGALAPTRALRQAFASVEREARHVFEDDGFAAPRAEPTFEPTRQLLFHVAHSDQSHPALDSLRKTFDLAAQQPSESELAHARGSLSGRNRALLDTVAAAIKEDLLRVKDALDLHLRTKQTGVADLQPQVEALGRVADTLGMMGLGVARNVVLQQRDAMHEIVYGNRAADEGALLDVAGALLYVDASLDDQVARLGRTGEDEEDPLASESRKVVDVLAREAIANFADARQAFVAFVETSWDHTQLTDVPRLLDEVAGALRILELPQPADYLTGIRRYTQNELLGRRRVPNGQQLDTLADALASLEYYLEALREQRPNRERILEIARQSLETLRYWPLPPAEAVAQVPVATDADADAETETETATYDSAPAVPAATPAVATPPAPPVPAHAPAPVATGAAGGFEATGDEIDDEIREVFLEEFEEEIGHLDEMLPPWRADPENLERLRPIRRVFHTLKGSGRLVGAKTLGEFSWKVENMLNRVLDGTRPPTPAVIAVVDQAFYTLPQLHAALRGEGRLDADLEGIQDVADRVAGGEEAIYSASMAAAAAATTAAAAEAAAPIVAMAEVAAVAAEAPGIPATVDPVLLEILGAEVGGHLATVDEWLKRATPAPVPAEDALLRSVHTMNGAFAMTEVPAITDVTGPAEGYIKRALAAGVVPSAEAVAALNEAAGAIRRTMTALQSPSPRVPVYTELAAQLTTLRDSLPEAKAAPFPIMEMDEELGALDLSEFTNLAETAPVDTGLPISATEETVAAELATGELDPTELAALDLSAFTDLADTAPVDTALPVAAEEPAADDFVLEDLTIEELDGAEAIELTGEESMLEEVPVESVSLENAYFDDQPLESTTLATTADDTAQAAQLEAERIAAAEAEEYARLEAEYAEADRIAREQQMAVELADAQRAEAERLEAVRLEFERLETVRLAEEAEQTEAARVAEEAERAEAARVAEEAERAEAARLAEEAERVEAARLAEEAERAEAARVAEEAERAEAARVAEEAERAEAARVAEEAERAEAARVAEEAERAEAARVAEEAERAEAARLAEEAERVEAMRLAEEAERLANEQAAAAAVEPAPVPELAIERLLATALATSVDPDQPLDLTDLDPELVDIFVEEGSDLLDHSDGLLAQLRAAPGEREPLVGLQRDLHTLKGGARMAGIMAVGELGHVMESLLEAVVEHRSELGRDGIPLLERGFDRLHAMITRVGARRAIAMPEALIAEFEARSRGEGYVASTIPAAPMATEAEPKVVELKPLSAPIDTMFGDEEGETGVRAPQEQVRIRADLLDRLVNYAGEVAIYRARLEQQLGAFRGAMVEMEQTNARLRDQLRRLDSETEAQIIARYQREHEVGDETFDPLELDRFSTLQQLSRGLAESAADLTSLQQSMDDLTRQYETLLLQQSRVSSDLQEGLMRTRMVPFDSLVPRLRRVVRQAATDTGKQVQLQLDGAQGELDRNVLERMTAPLEHMLRNAVAHGLESPQDRKKAKKPDEGTVRIAIRREGSEVVLEVSDDGAGLNRAAIRKRAEERGLVRSDVVLADADLDMLIMEPGFSTADEVSRLAGRGVGMDVVASEVRQLGGALDIVSKKGEGTNFILRLPQTLAVTQAVFVKIGETTFAVPIASVRGVGRIGRDKLAQGDAVYSYGGEDYTLNDLGTLVGHAPAKAEGQLQMPLLLIRSGELRAAVTIDHVLGNREIVVKPVGPQVMSVPGIFGATIMGDGSVVVILDIAPLVRRHAALPRDVEAAPAVEQRRVPLVMVVDDSVTMRKVTGRVLERHNFEVATAKDGLDALERMDERVPDLMLLDIEMPRMDGYELANAMKLDPRLRNVPIIMITSRTGEKHRQRAFEIGVERYLGKPYQEHELLRNVFDLLAQQRANEGRAND
ncbi:Hpt domain-containing protein [Lysobacter sp. CFH 32150]|uniref:Hpt domain-containing protein n=1 Tax=Lysobacter sp. CFH 32150 TaxID=2927128 RepID=UPI001FA7B461|nr:Hpt domain-containing protein [Lysobacter sp. CFH 32150]MCI4567810.1 Hpt domain-containing protein [Lysobacter sp. CFH 32150]